MHDAADDDQAVEAAAVGSSKCAIARPIIWFMCQRSAPTSCAMRTPSPVLPGLP